MEYRVSMSQPQRVLITGATSGLGREMARQLAMRGCRVAITGRREDRLRETAGIVTHSGGSPLMLVGSVTCRDTVTAHHHAIQSQWGGLDLAILNAGVGDRSNARTYSAEAYRWTFETNFFGVCNWLEAVLPGMVEQGSGTIAGVSSLASVRGMPGSGAYSSSKAALNTMLESVRVDLRGSGIRVVTITPGFIRSELTDRNDPRQMIRVLSTESGVRRMLRGIDRGRRVVAFPRTLAWPLRFVVRWLPGALYDPLAASLPARTKSPPRVEPWDGPESAGQPDTRQENH